MFPMVSFKPALPEPTPQEKVNCADPREMWQKCCGSPLHYCKHNVKNMWTKSLNSTHSPPKFNMLCTLKCLQLYIIPLPFSRVPYNTYLILFIYKDRTMLKKFRLSALLWQQHHLTWDSNVLPSGNT